MDKKRRIAFLSQYYGTVNRGAETYVIELAKRLNEKYDVEILKGTDSFSLKKILQGKYDFVVPTNGRLQALIASTGRVIGKYKVIISGQAGKGADDIWNIFMAVPDFYIALTEFQKQWASKWSWNSKLVKIPNGVDLEKFSPSGKKINLELPGKIILSVGALEWYKHHERSIEAVAKLEYGSLLIIGSGSEKEKLEKLANKKISGRFKIIAANYQDLPEFYRSADLFVLPSWKREAFGIVYLEAMASGLAIVAPNDSTRREIIGNAGILTDVTDPQKYADAIKESLLKKWGDKPRKQAEKFSWEIIASKYEEILT